MGEVDGGSPDSSENNSEKEEISSQDNLNVEENNLPESTVLNDYFHPTNELLCAETILDDQVLKEYTDVIPQLSETTPNQSNDGLSNIELSSINKQIMNCNTDGVDFVARNISEELPEIITQIDRHTPENIDQVNDSNNAPSFNPENSRLFDGGNVDETTELVVLHPEHPLMKRFQAALTQMLQEHISKISIELREKSEEVKREKEEHLELGSNLYNAQQELASFQGQLTQKHAEGREMQNKREAMDKELANLRQELRHTQQNYDIEFKKMISMREEVDNLCLRLFYLRNAKDEVKKDITVMRRAAEKAVNELAKMEEEKMHQDMLANRLQITVDQLTEDCAILEHQLAAQETDQHSGETLLHEMDAQIVGVRIDRKRLMAHWNTSLIGLQRRNEAYAALMDDYKKKQDELINTQSELEGVRKNTQEQQEIHERLTILAKRTEKDISLMSKQLEKLETTHELLREDNAVCIRTLSEVEKNLLQANSEKILREHDLEGFMKRLEKEYLRKHDLEDQIEEELRSKLTAKKAAEYVEKMTKHLHDQSRELESKASMLENQLSNDSLSIAKIQAETLRLKAIERELEDEINSRNDLVTKMELEVHHSNLLVQRKQNMIDMLNKKLDQMIKERGGVELGPLEIMLNHLTKGIAAKNDEIGILEQQWLKEQTELVKQVAEKERLCEIVSRQQCQLSILSKKKLRLDGEINCLERDKQQLNRDMTHLQNSMTRINKLIFVKKSSGTALEQENKLAEEDFLRALREKEQENVELQSRLESVIHEKEELLAELIEVEREIMLWEKKVQLVNETKQAVDSSVGQGEIKAMKTEIHRMELRKSQIARQQEQLIQALENSVVRRDTIIAKTEVLKNAKAKSNTKDALLRELDQMKKKISEAQKTMNEYAKDTNKLETEATQFEKDLKEKYSIRDAARNNLIELTKQLQKLAEYRQKCLIELQMRQHAARYWEQLVAGRYRRLCPSTSAAKSEHDRQLGRMRAMIAMIDRLTSEFPALQQDLAPVWHILAEKLDTEESLLHS